MRAWKAQPLLPPSATMSSLDPSATPLQNPASSSPCYFPSASPMGSPDCPHLQAPRSENRSLCRSAQIDLAVVARFFALILTCSFQNLRSFLMKRKKKEKSMLTHFEIVKWVEFCGRKFGFFFCWAIWRKKRESSTHSKLGCCYRWKQPRFVIL